MPEYQQELARPGRTSQGECCGVIHKQAGGAGRAPIMQHLALIIVGLTGLVRHPVQPSLIAVKPRGCQQGRSHSAMAESGQTHLDSESERRRAELVEGASASALRQAQGARSGRQAGLGRLVRPNAFAPHG